ncbi:hypothetical protein [Vibrio crassostreae]|uniref:Uncharacterized protein n=1 Tax=Vibrio crassostreae TaxID=246167 RepID=A0ABM9QPG8_9VIBR|nr:hypothetical protein [Vibrio crassostreae]TCL30373.1 hypothetical protein EDB52_101660 [Vibrio crassostreae]TCT53492.1 hypothetical protein EDB39_101558 [Vibrio crassostreae]TCT61956.1 hypothetical protein EDB40_1025 [Vibrio crassostreae]TCW19135.1 hypothetical protein EDB48_106251 [Vibrio crassostreae]CAK1714386.1 conserved hypothetical protein [Vibrio crassostreae]
MIFDEPLHNQELELSEYIKSLDSSQKEHLVYYAKSIDAFITDDLDLSSNNFNISFSRKIIETHTNESIKDIIKNINDILSNRLNKEHYDFIINDDLAAIFCYIHLLNNNVFSIYDDLIFFNNRGTLKPEVSQFRYKTSTTKQISVKIIRRDFINFIDAIQCEHYKKSKYISYLNRKYSESIKTFNFHWLDNKQQQDLWAHSYLTKQDVFKNKFRYLPAIFSDKKYSLTFMQAMFHALEVDKFEKNIILIKMKKAWGQVKYRNKIKTENKVTLNLVVDKSTSKNLKALSKEFDQPVNQIVSMMASRWVSNIEEVKEAIKKEKQKKIESFDRFM